MSLFVITLMINNSVRGVLKQKLSFKQFSTVLAMNKDIDKLIKQLPPSLSNDKHKGQAGRIGVFGGSLEYTGAPYFAAISSLKVGADLSHVFCSRDAAPVIKSYSPELIVHPLLDANSAAKKIEPWLDRLHVILIGPGLGREEETFKVIDEIIPLCRARHKPLVIDADGLFYLTQNSAPLHNYPAPIILTPNQMEFNRLTGPNQNAQQILSWADDVTILCKGHSDQIFNKEGMLTLQEGGSGRRCGGQGDLLSGAVAVFLGWSLEQLKACPGKSLVAAYAAAKLTRRCNERAFKKAGRSMTCSDMIGEIHGSFVDILGE